MVEQLRRPVPGGIGTYASGLLKGLSELGDSGPEVTLLASHPPGGFGSGPAGASRHDPLASLGMPLVTSRLPSRLLTRAWDAGMRVPVDSLDVVHAVSLGGPATGAVPSVACVHDLAWRSLPDAFPPRGRRWHEDALARALERSSRFVVPSESTAAALFDAGAAPGTVVVVEEGCDHLVPVDPEGTSQALASLGVGGPYLLCVGTLEPRKNLARLVSAYSAARGRLPEPWPLVVVGPRGWGPRLPPAPGVALAGPVDAGVLSGLYAGARCVAYVPLLEGWGLPAVEAMSFGSPVVASPMPSTAGEVIEVDPLDVAAIAEALVQASCDEGARERLRARGLARTAGLTWESAARAHVAVWESVWEEVA